MNPGIDYVVLPLVFAGLHVVSYALMKSHLEQTTKCYAVMNTEKAPSEADRQKWLATCTGSSMETKRKAISYMTSAAVVVGAIWTFRQLSGRDIQIGATALAIPALFLVGQTLDACIGPSCEASSLAASVVVGPAFWGTVAYTVLRLANRF